ncbi:VOC family protein [Ornithinimicrobium avium]|nr:VOC family protein [Ornithinimicrobium avium]
MTAVLDHLVLAVPDLDEAVRDLAGRTGVVAAPGGSHPGRGTRNALLGLTWRGGSRCYLELLGPDPEQVGVPPQDTMLGFGRLGRGFAPRLHTWAVRPSDLDATVRTAREAGIEVGEAVAASRATPSGDRLAWRLAVPDPLGFGGAQPFLIDWQGTAHPSDAELPVLELLGVELRHPDADALARVLRVLGVDVPVVQAPQAGLGARLGTPRGPVELG